MFYTYVLKSLKDSKYYIGHTNNIENRLKRHNSGQVKSTRNRVPMQVIWSQKFDTRAKSVNKELYLKSLKGGNQFYKIIEN